MNYSKEQSGQTLIETVVGISILIMGISSAIGLATFALGSTTNVTKQLIGMGLAREGVEAVRNMRDTNWLKDVLSTDCSDYDNIPGTLANCYKNWLGKSGSGLYCIDPSTGNGNCIGNLTTYEYYLGFAYNTSLKEYEWIFRKDNQYYGLDFDNANASGTGFYFSSLDTPCLSATSDYCRSVSLSKIGTAPYDKPDNTDIGPLLAVKSRVWWVAKNCPRVSTFAEAANGCRIELNTYLTNWRNY